MSLKIKIHSLLIVALMSTNLFALECNQTTFNKIRKEINKFIFLYKQSLTTEQERVSHISKDNYASDMKKNKITLTSLNEKKSSLLLASVINNDNINTWKALKKTCQGRDLIAIKMQEENSKKRKILVQKLMKHINTSIENKKLAIKIGNDEYKSPPL
jgi:hypothetical protein